VSIDDIIARRKLARPAIVAAGTSANGASGEDSEEVDEDDDEEDDDDGLDEAGPDAFDDDGEGLSDLDALIAEDDNDDNEGSALADADDLIAEGEDVEAVPDSDEDDDAASVASTSSSGSSISPFAQLANNAASLSDAEDEDINFSTAADKHIVDSNYFSKLPETSGNTVTSNEAHVTKSLPPFSALPGAALSRPILLGLSSLSLNTPTPIQAQTIPVALLGKDIVGSSITGSGKTVAFWVGILERLLYRDKKEARTRVVVICPTRELAVQVHNVGQALARYTDIRFCLCVGGLSLKVQEADLRKRPDIVVSTPGRLIDHVRNTASFSLESLEILVIDEADRILEEGFRDELSEIIDSCPHSRQTMLFSATITEDIQTLARLSLQKPVRIAIDAVHTTSTNLKQEFVKVKQDTLREPMLIALCRRSFASQGKTIVFFRSKLGAHRMRVLFGLMGLRAEELHGDLTQEMRLTSLKKFRDGEVGFLLATDLASVSAVRTLIALTLGRC
jgi:ATP-dependent RNA helicase DDX27